MDKSDILKQLKAEVKYVPLQGNYLLVHETDLMNFLRSGHTDVSRQRECEDLLIKLANYIFDQRDNGDYYSRNDIYLDRYAREINKYFGA